jgi:hypothetical protein
MHARIHVFVIVGLFLANVATYHRVCQHEFLNFDDPLHLSDNPHMRDGLTRETLVWAFLTFEPFYWHPMTWLSLLWDRHLFGSDPGAYHRTNLLLHATNCILLYLLTVSLGASPGLAATLALAWGLHPFRVEPVAWVTARKDLVSGMFGLATLLAYVNYARRPHWGRYAVVGVAFVLGLMAKPMLMTLPAVLCLLDYWPLGRLPWPRADSADSPFPVASWRRIVWEKWPLFLLAWLFWKITTIGTAKDVEGFDAYPFDSRLRNALSAIPWYVAKTFWPSALSPFYMHHGDRITWTEAGLAAVFIVVGTGLAVAAARRNPYLFVGWFCFVGMMTPVLGFVQVGYAARADRYTYLPHVGLIAASVIGLAELARRSQVSLRWQAILASCVLFALAAVSYRQTAFWHDSKALWTRAIEVSEDNSFAYYALGQLLADTDETDRAVEYCREAIRIHPNKKRYWLALLRALEIQGDAETLQRERDTYHELLVQGKLH